MAEPERDHGDVIAGEQETHRGGVAQRVHGDPLSLERGAVAVGDGDVVGEAPFDRIAAEAAAVDGGEQRIACSAWIFAEPRAFVLLHNDHGDATAAAERVLQVFGPPTGEMRTQLLDVQANFADSSAQGSLAYVKQFVENHPDEDAETVATDGQLAVAAFTERVLR